MLTSGEYLNFLASQDALEVMGPDSVSHSALALTDVTLVSKDTYSSVLGNLSET